MDSRHSEAGTGSLKCAHFLTWNLCKMILAPYSSFPRVSSSFKAQLRASTDKRVHTNGSSSPTTGLNSHYNLYYLLTVCSTRNMILICFSIQVCCIGPFFANSGTFQHLPMGTLASFISHKPQRQSLE